MVRDIVKDYPDLGSFWYGHWEKIELTPTAFLILTSIVLFLLALIVVGGILGYVLGAIATSKIAKKQGAWRNIRIMACFPFVRYFAIGKVAERCDVLQNAEKRRLWGRVLLISSCILVPITVLALAVAVAGLPFAQLFVLYVEDGGSFLWDSESKLVDIVMLLMYLLLIVIALPAILLVLILNDAATLILVVLPFAGIACLLLGVVLVAVIRTLSGKCYYRILRTAYAEKTAMILTVIGALTGLSPYMLYAASRKKE